MIRQNRKERIDGIISSMRFILPYLNSDERKYLQEQLNNIQELISKLLD